MSHMVFSQTYDELKILFADGNYEKLLDRAIKITENDKRKQESAAYFWAAHALYKISITGETDEKYKNAYQEAIAYLGKGLKYDIKSNDRASILEFDEFLEEFQLSLQIRIMNEWEQQLPKKAYSLAIKYVKITENPVGAKYMAGACKLLDGDQGTSRTLWTDADKLMEGIESIDSWGQADKDILMNGILASAEALKTKRQIDKAKILLNKAAPWFEGNEVWQAKYDEIVN